MSESAKFLVIGSSGFLGNHIANRLKVEGEVVSTHFQQQRIPNSVPYDFFHNDIGLILEKYQIDTIILAAVVEAAPLEELSVAMDKFVRGCKECRLIYLSSDGIYDGQKGNYTEDEIPYPATHYGINLATCEKLITQNCSDYCIVRPSYIYGFSNGKLDNRLVKTSEQLKTGKEVTLFGDMFKSPLGVEQVAQAVIDLAKLPYVGIVHVAGERMSVYDFHLQAMAALKVDTSRLSSCAMPIREGFLRDTSLDSSRWQKLTGSKPRTIDETLSNRL